MGKTFGLFVGLILALHLSAQADSTTIRRPDTLPGQVNTSTTTPQDTSATAYEKLINAPARAAFYSAVLPGLGQAYNRQYWKIPLVYAAIGTAVYFYRQNQLRYLTYRRAYQNRLLGRPDDFPQYSDDVLLQAQAYYRRNRDISLMLAVGMYLLNIMDANVSAHLRQWNVNDNLSFRPVLLTGSHRLYAGLGMQWRF